MRKLTVLSLAGLLILAFSAVGYAQAPKLEFRASGFIDMQYIISEGVPQYNTGTGIWGVVNGNYSKGTASALTANMAPVVLAGTKDNGWDRHESNFEARAHLKFDAVMGPNLSGTIYFEIDAMRWGGVFNVGPSTREANNFAAWTTDRTAVEVKNIYIDVGLPYFGIPVPITVRVGAQPIGVRPNVLVYSDGAGITAGIKIDPVMIMPIYAKALQGTDYTADGSNVYGLHANAKVGTFTVGGYGLTYNMDTYPFWVITGNLSEIAGQSSATGYTGMLLQTVGTFKSHMWWFGAYADGKAGPVNMNFDFVYDYGSVDDILSRDAGVPIPNVAYEGWMSRLKIDYPWEKFNFGVVGMYATGADTRRTSAGGSAASPGGLPGTTTAPSPLFPNGTNSTRVSSYVVPPGSEQGPANGESVVVYGMEPGATGGYGIADNANYNGMSRGGFGGTWFAKLYSSMKLTPWYKLTLQGLYIGDTTRNGTTFGDAVKYVGLTPTPFLRNAYDIGWEFDLMNDIQIYNNLRWFVGAGYLFAGNAMDVVTNGGNNRSAVNPWAIRTRLMYTF